MNKIALSFLFTQTTIRMSVVKAVWVTNPDRAVTHGRVGRAHFVTHPQQKLPPPVRINPQGAAPSISPTTTHPLPPPHNPTPHPPPRHTPRFPSVFSQQYFHISTISAMSTSCHFHTNTHTHTRYCPHARTHRLEIYSYWNQGGAENVLSMLLTLGDRYLLPPGVAPSPGAVRETPAVGLFHPLAGRYFATPREYMAWYEKEQQRAAEGRGDEGGGRVADLVGREGLKRGKGVAPPGSPKVAVLLYRKHVVTRQGYISQMIRYACWWGDVVLRTGLCTGVPERPLKAMLRNLTSLPRRSRRSCRNHFFAISRQITHSLISGARFCPL